MDWWAWRLGLVLMCICISAMIIACAATNPSPVLTPAELPPITLTLWIAATSTPLFSTVIPMTATPAPIFTQTPLVYVVDSDEAVEEIAADFGIEPESLQIANPPLQTEPPKVGQRLVIPRNLPTLVPPLLQLVPPTCYPTPPDLSLCMGYVQNTTTEPLQRVSVLVELIAMGGERVAAEVAGVEQHVIPAGSSAPYRVLFREQPYHQMIISLRSADPVIELPPAVTVQGETVSNDERGYVIEGRLLTSTPFDTVRVVATVYGDNQEVVGYRIVDLAGIIPDTPLPFRVDIQPVIGGGDLTHTLHVEGWMNTKAE